jgi:chemotaxis regulatin CheY-phosphate phosphatase CheZ
MADDKLKELSLELGEGSCRVMVDGLALNIALKMPKMQEAPRPALLPEPHPAPSTEERRRLLDDLDYYRQTSMDIYNELGQLAKGLNISLQDLTVAEVLSCKIDSPGEQLDQARLQINKILEMTEKATLNIMDLVEEIRQDCSGVRQNLLSLAPLAEDWDAGAPAAAKPDAHWGDAVKSFLAQVMAQGQELDRRFHSPAPATPAGPAPPPPPVETGLHFPLAEILQIVLEFCGNEALKQHLKAVIAKQKEIFRLEEAEAAFTRLGAGQPEEDGFSQFPVEEVLKILQSTCDDNRFKDLFAKMLASAGKLFPMPVLPLEGHPVEAAPAPAAPAAPAEPQGPGFLPMWEDFFQKLQQLAVQVETAPVVPPPAAAAVDGDKIKESIGLLDHVNSCLTRILEALTFQDLSGQKLLQLLKLLRQLQYQILTMVVAAGTKLKIKSEQKGVTLEESGMLAQDEIDRMLQTIAPVSAVEVPEDHDAGQVLDQDAVNALLTNMGF